MNSDIIEFYFYSAISLSCLYLIIITYYKYFIARDWEQAFSEIIEFKVQKETKGRYLNGGKDKEVKSLNIQYTYSIADETYKGKKLSLTDDLPIFSNFQPEIYTMVNKHLLNGSKLPIYINPKNIQSSLINRELNISKITILLIVSIIFFLLSLNKLNTSISDSFSLYSYLICFLLLVPIIYIERFTFKNNQSYKISANKRL